MKLKKLLAMVLCIAMVLSTIGVPVFAAEGNVAKVGDTEYATIDEAIANWTNGTTLTLLDNVTLSDVIKISSTEHHILDLGTYTMTAASSKDAIQYVVNGRSSMSYALDIKADDTNPGGITATGKTIVSHIKPSSGAPSKDRPITRFYGGVFNASYVVKQGATGFLGFMTDGYTGASAPAFYFYGGEFNGTIYTNRSINQFYGGTFNGSMQMSVDSSAYTMIAGGTFKNLSNSMGSDLTNGDKFTIGSSKGANNGSVCIDENGNYVITTTTPVEAEASVASNYNGSNYFYYSTVNTNGMYYEDVYDALEKNKTGEVTVFADELDLSETAFEGTIVVPEGEEITIVVAEGTTPAWTIESAVENEEPNVTYEDTNGNELVKNESGVFEEVTPAAPVEVYTYDELVAALEKDNANVIMMNDITGTATAGGYNLAGIVVQTGDVVDGNNNKLTINGANSTWDCAVAMTGGTVKNLTVAGAMRGIFMPGANGDVVIDNCVFEDVIYTFNSDAGSKDYTVTVMNSALNGWTSFSDVHKSVTFENCTFGEGSGYAFLRPYQPTDFNGCDFDEGFEFDTSMSVANSYVFNDCTYAGEELNEETAAPLFAGGGTVVIDGETVEFGEYVPPVLSGSGTETDPYLINNIDDLKWFRDDVNAGNNYAGKYVKLNDDIDMSSVDNWTPIGETTYNKNYEPVDPSVIFSGVFDGNNKKISNLKIEKIIGGGADAEANLGLFGFTGEDAVIKDLTITNVNINTDGRNVGALAGFAYKSELENITINGNIQIKGGNNVSGVCAMTRYHDVSATNITVSGAEGSAITGNNIVGGIFAEIAPNGSTQTFKNLSIENVAINGVGGVGGIVGLLTNGSVSDVSVKNVGLVGKTTWKENEGRIRLGSVAGLLGSTSATISNVTVENVTAKNLEGEDVVLPVIGANYDASSNATEAKIVDTYYATLAKAVAAAEEGDTITLLCDIDDVVEIPAGVTLDKNGYRFGPPSLPTATVSEPVINTTVMAMNGLSGEAFETPVTFKMNFKADDPTDVQKAYYGDWIADYELTVNKNITGKDAYLVGQYDFYNENWVKLAEDTENVVINKNQSIKVISDLMPFSLTYNFILDNVKDFDCGIYLTPEFIEANPDLEITLALKLYNPENEEESYVIGEAYKFTAADAMPQAQIGDTTYQTLAAAIEAAKDGDTVTVLKNITLDDTLTVSAGKNVTLDLAGKTISQVKEQTTGYQMILNDGSLTINDSVGNGKISYTDSGNGGEYISDTIYNRGTLVINGGTIENISSATVAQNGYPHAVDTYSGIRDTSVTINGGTVYCDKYSAIRMFCVSSTKKADLVINNGTIKGAVDMQNGTSTAALGTLDINGGTFQTTANKNNIRFANWNGGATTYGITAYISDGTFNGGISTAYVPAAANWNSAIVSGGTFTSNPGDQFAAEGFEFVENADGTFGVQEVSAEEISWNSTTAVLRNMAKISIAGLNDRYGRIRIFGGIDDPTKYDKYGFKYTITKGDKKLDGEIVLDIAFSGKVRVDNTDLVGETFGNGNTHIMDTSLCFAPEWVSPSTKIKITPFVEYNGTEYYGTPYENGDKSLFN